MATPALNFGVQSWCFRNFKDPAACARKVREIGLDRMEICGVHADFNKPQDFKKVVDTIKNEGVSLVSMGVQTFVGADNERDWFECARIGGFNHISAHFKVDTFSTAVPKTVKLAEEFNLRIGIHCHGGYMFGGSPDVLDHLLKIGGPRIGINIDTAWCMQIGPNQGNPVKWVERYKGRIYGVHYKDFTFDRNGQFNDVVVGTGNLDLKGFVDALTKANFDGMAVIEYEAQPENPVGPLKECVQQMRKLTA
jgi:sugar phosphate isomerase/epimerase